MSEPHKTITEDLVVIQVASLDSNQMEDLIKTNVQNLVSLYQKSHDNLRVQIVTDENLENKQLVIAGDRWETDKEKDARLGIDRAKSWPTLYADIAKVSLEEATSEMSQMFSEGKLVSPAEWKQYKADKVKDILNIEEEE
jgi:hypothetical protein